MNVPTTHDLVEEISEKCQPEMTVTLSSHQWATLLTEMEDHMSIVNRDQRRNNRMFELIASQLSGKDIKIAPREPKPFPPERTVNAAGDQKKPWWKRIF